MTVGRRYRRDLDCKQALPLVSPRRVPDTLSGLSVAAGFRAVTNGPRGRFLIPEPLLSL